MTAKEYLSQIEKLDRQINEILEEIYRLKTVAYGTTSLNDSERVQASLKGDKLCDAVTRIVTLEQEADILTDRFCDRKADAIEHMKRLENKRYYEILYDRYINYKSIYRLAEERKSNYKNMKRLHRQALVEYQKILDIVL